MKNKLKVQNNLYNQEILRKLKQNIKLICYALNFFFPVIVFIIKYLFRNESLLLEYIFIYSFIGLVTSIFSLNARNLLLATKSINNTSYFLLFRIKVFFTSIFLIYFIIKYSNFENYILDLNVFSVLLLSTFIFLFWIIELIITFYDLKSLNKKIYKSFLFQIFLINFFTILVLFKISFHLIIFFLIILIILFYINDFFKIINLNKKKIKLFTSNFSFSINLFSTISISLSIIFIRFFFISLNSYNKSLDLIFFFTIGSFPSTLFVNSFGIHYLRDNSLLPLIIKYMFYLIYISIFFTIIIILLTFFNFDFLSEFIKNNIYFIFFSLLGSILLYYAQVVRLTRLLIKEEKNYLFLDDILYSISSLFIIYIIVFKFPNLLKFSFLIISFLCLYLYLARHSFYLFRPRNKFI